MVRKFFLILVALTLTTLGSSAVAQDEPLVLVVGNTQAAESLNVTVGALVTDYEVWNLQYATLTDKAANDFATIPGLAESWEASNNGLTYTYKLRSGLLWSDGQPLTAEDIAWTVNTSRDQEWLNHSAVTANLTATVIDPETVEITSSVSDPKLPTMDVYIVPKHTWENPAAGDITEYDGEDGVGSGPFVLDEHVQDQFIRMVANPNYWQGQPVIDEIILQNFTNPDAMVAALENGDIDAANNVPAGRFADLSTSPDIVTVQGQQGGFDELSLNAGAGLKPGHPALLDIRVRQAINHAIDKSVIVQDVLQGLGEPALAMSPSPDPKWRPDIPVAGQFNFDLAKANQILDEAGYLDTDGDGIRQMPDGSNPLNFIYAIRTESEVAVPISEFVIGWLKEIGIGTTTEAYDDGQLTEVIGKGEYDMFVWGWIPFVDPDTQLWYFHSDQLSKDPEDPLNYYNDASWSNARYDELYTLQNQELDPAQRVAYVQEMLTIFYQEGAYIVLYYSPDLQAYRTDRFEGWIQQPADVGPVIFSNTSPSYFNLKPVSAAPSTTAAGTTVAGTPGTTVTGGSTLPPATVPAAGGGNTGLIVGIVAAVVVIGLIVAVTRRRGGEDERE